MVLTGSMHGSKIHISKQTSFPFKTDFFLFDKGQPFLTFNVNSQSTDCA